VVIRFFASLRKITGVTEVAWRDAPPTLGDLLHRLAEHYGPEFRRWVLDGEELGAAILVIVNGDDVRHREGLKTRLAPDDVISLLPMMAGGRSFQRSAISFQPRQDTELIADR
jgi:MoaD family protein